MSSTGSATQTERPRRRCSSRQPKTNPLQSPVDQNISHVARVPISVVPRRGQRRWERCRHGTGEPGSLDRVGIRDDQVFSGCPCFVCPAEGTNLQHVSAVQSPFLINGLFCCQRVVSAAPSSPVSPTLLDPSRRTVRSGQSDQGQIRLFRQSRQRTGGGDVITLDLARGALFPGASPRLPPRCGGRDRVSLRRRVPDGQLGPTRYRPVRDTLF
jgi:hypothetical protein